MYLLDTNHCSRLLQGHPSITEKLHALGNVTIATSVIVRGELIFMAQKSERQAANLRQVHRLLDDLQVYPLDNETAERYGKLKAAILDRFGPKEKKKRTKIQPANLGFTDNDLWIAAAAQQHNLIVVSADSDFERMKTVANFRVEKWWSPEMDRA